MYFCQCVIAINPKVLYHFKVGVFEEIFGKCGVRRGRLVRRNQRFLLTLKEKINIHKRSFIDDSNKYKFIYVSSSSSKEKKNNTFDERRVFNFFPKSLCRGDRSLDAMCQTVVKMSAERTLLSHVTEACIPCDKLL